MTNNTIPDQPAIRGLLRLFTAGSVDDGKSTLIGRLLYDSKSIFDDQFEALRISSELRGEDKVNLALLTDGLRAEREQGITIDVAYRYFATPKRKFIIADTPGHIQYTRNMITGSSTANLAIIMVDARNGMSEQTSRHTIITSLMGIRHIIVCVNKMDLMGYREDVFDKIRDSYGLFASKLEVPDVQYIPISALAGDNVVEKSANMPWYKGNSLLHTLEKIRIANDDNFNDCRFPVQYVIRPQSDEYHDYRGYAGKVAGGVFRKGDKVTVLSSGIVSTIKAIDSFDGEIQEARPGMSVTILLEDDIDIGRGDMLASPGNLPNAEQSLDIMLCWMSETKLVPGGKYALKHATQDARCIVKDVHYKIDINTQHRIEGEKEMGLNDIGSISIRTTKPLYFDSYRKNRPTGNLILIDEATNETVGAGMIL